ncbi:T-lymphocyte activation antigen CD80 isoform X1 [Amia ocellicauda]|uniref:T-lymphocyte activation antigen CD80 isoform X1 n=1 Tax=Amia ocellicauda TaxID=2972642 RepID=UPI003464063E
MSWYLMIAALLICATDNSSTGNDCIVGVIGEATVLPCHYTGEERLEQRNIALEWRTDSVVVHSFVNGEDVLNKQGKNYHNRTHLFKQHLEKGNFSLRLSDTGKEDEQHYKCLYYSKSIKKTIHLNKMCLSVAAHYSEPGLHRVPVPEGGDAQFSCSSSGGFPEPRVHWLLNSQRPPVDIVNTVYTQDPVTGLYRVSSRLNITVNITQDITVSCTIENPRLNESRSSATHHYHRQTEDQNEGSNSLLIAGIVVAVAVAVAVAVIVLLKRRSLCRVCGRHLQHNQRGARDEAVPMKWPDNDQAGGNPVQGLQ